MAARFNARRYLGRRPLADVGNYTQSGRPKTIRPALALADLIAQPSPVVIDAFLGAKALERAAVPHQAELAVAVRAVVLHCLLAESCRYRPLRTKTRPCNRGLLQCTISITVEDCELVAPARGLGRRFAGDRGPRRAGHPLQGRHAHPFASGREIATEEFARFIAP